MCRFILLTFSFLLCERVLTLSIDQRQTGDLNVQIDLKDFKVFALTKGKEDYVDYDYAYDYSEMTIKPQNGTTGTTIKPLNTTEAILLIENDNVTISEFESTTKIIENNASIFTTEKEVTTTAVVADFSSSTATTTITIAQPPHEILLAADNHTDTAATTATTLLDCKKGFYRNNKGNCELKLQSPSNILFKMLQQKSKASHGPRKT